MGHRAISPAITSIFLIGLAVTGAVSAGNAMFKQNDISQKSARLDILDAQLIRLGDDKAYFGFTVKNTGTVTFASVNIRMSDGTGALQIFTDESLLEPGDQISKYLIDDMVLDSGVKYLVHIDGVTTSGSAYSIAQTVTARG
ncbi:exported hypothetical protein [Candidatus Nitrosotenuis uzonensis]|uniref:Uncharacterized protein n=2 Tax=Candidatus Nitrosotenuis uzonensis TaxID=1407055 RepID=V6AQM5_9ARCH|nr:exported hypothetical protein [Candidatus Nitrosotenuis uzonensis]